MNQRFANPLAALMLSNDDHRDVAVRHAVGDGTKEANDFTLFDCNEFDL